MDQSPSFSITLRKNSNDRRPSLADLTKSWPKQNFVLHGSILTINDEEGRQKKGEINLSGSVITKKSSSTSRFRTSNYAFEFEIKTKDNETFQLKATSEEERERCIREFTLAATLIPGVNASYLSPRESIIGTIMKLLRNYYNFINF
jgi:hypothetical protein